MPNKWYKTSPCLQCCVSQGLSDSHGWIQAYHRQNWITEWLCGNAVLQDLKSLVYCLTNRDLNHYSLMKICLRAKRALGNVIWMLPSGCSDPSKISEASCTGGCYMVCIWGFTLPSQLVWPRGLLLLGKVSSARRFQLLLLLSGSANLSQVMLMATSGFKAETGLEVGMFGAKISFCWVVEHKDNLKIKKNCCLHLCLLYWN